MNLGKYGESLAKLYLERKGFQLIRQNYRYERAEIDLVFKDEKNKILVFTEVKTRKSKTFGEPEGSVIEKKQKQIIKSAQGFLMDNPEYEEYEKRFDVIAVYLSGRKEEINHIENAF
ncbi:MAG: YraN family protein [Ignavibacteria bacterium]